MFFHESSSVYVVNNVILVSSSGFEFPACSVCVYILIEKKKKEKKKKNKKSNCGCNIYPIYEYIL